ncbi:MAG: hypothetical protein ACFFDP_02445 [Promethearchaeota archaeon]
MNPFETRSPIQSNKLDVLRQILKGNPAKQALMSCLSDGMWHTTTELARIARSKNPVLGLVTIGTVLTGMQQQLGEDFLEQMVQTKEEGVSSWRMGLEWLDVIKEIIRELTEQKPSSTKGKAS